MHKRYVFSHVTGTFLFNEHFKPIKKELFRNIEQYFGKEKTEEKISKDMKNISAVEGKALLKILSHFEDKAFRGAVREMNIALTKQQIKGAVGDDNLIMQTISTSMELSTTINRLMKRLREWYGLYDPEIENKIQDHAQFVEHVLKGEKTDSLMGADLGRQDIEAIKQLAFEMQSVFALKAKEEKYLEVLMKKACPNLLALAGAELGAKLMLQAGGLKNLMEFPASTIQVLGAEKALFRHMKTGSKSPRHGYIASHPLLAEAPQEMHGKIARGLADKIGLAVKIDYFKGDFIGDKLLKGLEKKFA